MKTNVNSYDSAVRFVAGCILLALANRGHRWGFAGIPLIVTAWGFCPFYWLFRIGTAADDSSKPPTDWPRRSPSTGASGVIDRSLNQITKPARCYQPSTHLTSVNLNSERSRRHFADL